MRTGALFRFSAFSPAVFAALFRLRFPASLDNMVQCDVAIALGNVAFTPDAIIDCACVEKVLVKAWWVAW